LTDLSNPVSTAREYYNSDSADRFYASIWGGEDIHIGLYERDGEPILDASHRTVEKLASLLDVNQDSQVLDIGAGYGGTARHLAKTVSCHVACLNLSEVQNDRNRKLNQEQGLQDLIDVIDGNFEDIPLAAGSQDIVLSQDAILHSGDRQKVVQEVCRVLKPGGQFVFTDIMQSDDCPAGVLQPVLDRIYLSSLGSPGFYRQTAAELGMQEVQFLDLSQQLVNHYSSVLAAVDDNYEQAVSTSGKDYIDRMKVGLNHWIEAGKNGHICWGFLCFRK